MTSATAPLTRAAVEAMKPADLLRLYNDVTGSMTKKFSSREAGLKQTLRALEGRGLLIGEVAGEPAPAGEPVADEAVGPAEAEELAGEPGPVAAEEPARAPADDRCYHRAPVAADLVKPIRKGTAQHIVASLLARPEGASLDDIAAATGNPNIATCRSWVSWDIGAVKGLGFWAQTAEGVRRYYLVLPPGMETFPTLPSREEEREARKKAKWEAGKARPC